MTNNQLTKEWLQQTIAELESVRDEIPFGIDTNSELELAAFKMALAAMDSEPVAYTDERNLGYIDRGRETAYLWGKQNSEASDVALYRHAQPAPVVPEEMTPQQASRSYGGEVRGYRDGWNACRAAMLQDGDAVRDLSTPVDPQVAEYEQNVMQAGNSPVIPDGYVMVPKGSTEGMVIAGFESEPDEQ